jgi:predicted DsbA family dithiol-disulfide isomerase
VRWLPFQLNPDLPESGIPREEYVARKFGARGKSVSDRVTLAGRQVGIAFDYDRMKVQPNTLHAHRLLTYAERAGRQDELAEALFQAHFVEGASLAERETLADIAARAGLDRKAASDFLAGDEERARVAAADVEARNAGIGGVPYFIFNRKVGVSGAQDPGALLEAMEQSLEEQRG